MNRGSNDGDHGEDYIFHVYGNILPRCQSQKRKLKLQPIRKSLDGVGFVENTALSFGMQKQRINLIVSRDKFSFF